MFCEPRKDCFAYDKVCDKCRALDDLYCRKELTCAFYKKDINDIPDTRSEMYYKFRLEQYFKDHYGKYADEVEYFPKASSNSCEFFIPSRGEIIKLLCSPQGRITALRKAVSKKYGG